MDDRNPSSHASGGSPVSDDRLESWKEIAYHLRRQVRTVQRWEATEGLPIHRRQASKYGPVFAYKSEIDLWWKARPMSSRPRQPDCDRTPKLSTPAFKFLFSRLAIYAVLIVALALSIAKAKQMFLKHESAAPSHPLTIAVLPFQSVSDNLDDTNAALNLTDEVITDCKRSNVMHVVDQTLVMPFRNSADNPQHIAQLLHSDKVLRGTASRSGSGVHVAAQLIDSKSGAAVWSREFDENSADLLESEKQIASSIASDVENVLTEESHSLP